MLLTPAPLLQNIMIQNFYNNSSYDIVSATRGRIARPYSGQCRRNGSFTKVERGHDFYDRFTH